MPWEAQIWSKSIVLLHKSEQQQPYQACKMEVFVHSVSRPQCCVSTCNVFLQLHCPWGEIDLAAVSTTKFKVSDNIYERLFWKSRLYKKAHTYTHTHSLKVSQMYYKGKHIHTQTYTHTHTYTHRGRNSSVIEHQACNWKVLGSIPVQEIPSPFCADSCQYSFHPHDTTAVHKRSQSFPAKSVCTSSQSELIIWYKEVGHLH